MNRAATGRGSPPAMRALTIVQPAAAAHRPSPAMSNGPVPLGRSDMPRRRSGALSREHTIAFNLCLVRSAPMARDRQQHDEEREELVALTNEQTEGGEARE